jgi:SAM-dependent methyltransferase
VTAGAAQRRPATVVAPVDRPAAVEVGGPGRAGYGERPMARRCLVATALGHLPVALDDGLLGAHRRRLLHRAAGRVLDLSPRWEPNLLGYHRGRVEALTVTGHRGAGAAVTGVPRPDVVPRAADAEAGAFDTVVLAFAVCTADDPVQMLAEAARHLRPGGQVLVLEHVGGTGLTGMVQLLAGPAERALGMGCRFDLDVPAAAEGAGLVLSDCARFRLWVAVAVPTPCLAGVLVPRPPTLRGAR